MAAHDIGHLGPVRRTTGRSVENRERLAKIFRADCGRGDHAEHLHVAAAVIIEPMNGTSRNTACPGPTSIGLPSTVQVNTSSTP